jgi:ribonucleoside-diphosphate reductase beta chain
MSQQMLTQDQSSRLTVFPIKNERLWQHYKKMEAMFWTAEEIDWKNDKHDFNTLNEDEQRFIKHVLAFFAISDIIVNINLGQRLSQEIQILEAQIAYQFQMMMENIHSEVYSLQIDNIIDDPEEKMRILNAIETIPCIETKSGWMLQWVNSTESIATRLLAQGIAEGLFFSGSFCAIFWLKQKYNGGDKRSIMQGLINSNKLISRDEESHTELSIILYEMCEDKLKEDKVHRMFADAVEIEEQFVCDSLPCSLIGMNAGLMKQYIKYVADTLLERFGYNKLYNVQNSFPWMETLSLENKTNFFEYRPTEYQKADVLNKTKGESYTFSDDF